MNRLNPSSFRPVIQPSSGPSFHLWSLSSSFIITKQDARMQRIHHYPSYAQSINILYLHFSVVAFHKYIKVYLNLFYLLRICRRSASDIFPEFPVSSRSNIEHICNIYFSVTCPISFILYITNSDFLKSPLYTQTQLSINYFRNE